MSSEICFTTDQADIEKIAQHLEDCDGRFVPALSTRVDIPGYAGKLLDRATRFEAWHDGRLIGLVAAYFSDLDSGTAFITNVSVLAAWAARGVGSSLLRECIEHARQLEMRRIKLEVSNDNRAATAFYEKHGFVAESLPGRRNTETLSMTINLKNGS